MEAKRVIDCCVTSYQKTRSILMESNGYTDEDSWQLSFVDPFLFNEDTENLVWKWASKETVEPMDAYNAISWVRLKSIPWWFELQGFLQDANLGEYINDQKSLLTRGN